MIGRKILHYEITEEIGRGGMGIVYKATDTKLKRSVALKFLPPAVGPEDRARFEVEAQSVAHLQHPNICGIHEINEIDGQTFIVMPFLDGTELKHLTAAGPMEIPEAVEVTIQVANALHEAHEHDIIHRDVKSANVIVTRKGLAKVMDFGLAKRKGSTQITQAGTSLGTIDYMSPEQAAGNPADNRTDIWSLGVMLYEMLTGEMPFRGEFDQAIIYSILNQDPAPVSTVRAEVPAQLDEILALAMAKNPDERYQNIEDMLADLLDIQQQIGVPDSIGGSTVAVAGRPSTGTRRRAVTTASPGDQARPNGRRLVAVLAVYAVLSVVLVLALGWLVDHFPVSPHLPGFVFVVLTVLLPAVFVLTYFRGGHILKKAGVPVYIVAAAAVMFLFYQNKDLGAAIETVRITDENGNTIERALPKGEFRKRFAIFYFDNDTGETALDWMSYGIAQMLRYDLNQDTYVAYGLGFTISHKEAGFEKPVGSPLPIKREFANRFHYPRFTAGSITGDNDEFVVNIVLYDTGSGRPILERVYRGTNIFAIVDTMSLQLRRDVGVPEYYIAENPDLPVSEIFTGSLEALEHYVNGVNAIYQINDHQFAAAEMERAISIDPAFALASWQLSGVLTTLNRGDEAREVMSEALKQRYRLPENDQYNLLNDYYVLHEDAEAGFDNARRWVALHPGSAGAHEALAGHYERVSDYEAAIAERKILFEIDPQRFTELHVIGRLYENLGDDGEALRYYEQYAELHPDKYASFTTIGRFHRQRGNYDLARDYYKKALLIDPQKMFIRTNLAEIERHTGDFNASLKQCMDALESARTPGDSSTAQWQLVEYYSFRGEAKSALEYMTAAFETMERSTHPIQVMMVRLFTLGIYVDAGRFDEAMEIARTIEEQANVPFIKPIVSAGYIISYAANEDPAYLPEVEKHTARFEKWIEESGSQNLLWALEYCRSLVEYWNGDLQASQDRIKNALAAIPPDEVDNRVWMLRSAAEISRELKNYVEAQYFIGLLLELEPFSPEAHFEAAQIYHAQGQTQKAIEHLKKALQVWENADPDHRRAKRARELAEQLRLSS